MTFLVYNGAAVILYAACAATCFFIVQLLFLSQGTCKSTHFSQFILAVSKASHLNLKNQVQFLVLDLKAENDASLMSRCASLVTFTQFVMIPPSCHVHSLSCGGVMA